MRRILIIVFLSALYGCVGSNTEYPKNWAALTYPSDKTCPNISGKYRAISEPLHYYKGQCNNIGIGWYCRSLPEDLINIKSTITEDSWVKISNTNDTELIIVTGISNVTEQEITLRSKDKQFECNDEGITIKIASDFMADSTGFGVNTGIEKTFIKSEDGALIMKETSAGGGLAFYTVPVAGSSTQWWRWHPSNY